MSDLPHFDPFTNLGALRDAMRQLLDEGWVGPRDLLPSALASILVPVDVLDTGPDIVIRAAMPGVKAEPLKITLSGSTLTLKGEVAAEEEFEDAIYFRRERRASAYTRSLMLPVAVDADHAQAVFRDHTTFGQLLSADSMAPPSQADIRLMACAQPATGLKATANHQSSAPRVSAPVFRARPRIPPR